MTTYPYSNILNNTELKVYNAVTILLLKSLENEIRANNLILLPHKFSSHLSRAAYNITACQL